MSDPRVEAMSEVVAWLEQQLRLSRDENARTHAQVEMVQRQIHDLADQLNEAERSIREIEPRFNPFRGIPEKITTIDVSMEDLRQALATHRSELDNTMRLLRAEAEVDRHERGEAYRRIEAVHQQFSATAADIAQVQAQVSQVSQTGQSILERQREVEARVEQFGLRLDRSIEVNRDLGDRLQAVLTERMEERFDVIFERLQVIGEMVRRNEEVINNVANERSLRQELIHEVSVWRDQHNRIDGRLNALEEITERLVGNIDRVHGEVTLLEGRHSGLGERVAAIRRDIAEVVDHVRDEFAKYNQMMEKQRRKQIQVLEQELREMKFHAFRPPEEP